MSVRRALTTTFLLFLCLSGDGAVDAREESFASRYRALVDAYRNGQTKRAINGLLGLDSGRLGALVRRQVELANTALGTPGVDEPFLRAASLLHTDAAIRLWTGARHEEPWEHLDLARRLVDTSAHQNEEAGAFRPRWYTATTLIVAAHAAPQQTLDYFEDAIEPLPDEVPLLTVAGWFSERMSTRPVAPPASLQRSQTLRRQQQRTAIRYLTAALEVDPRAPEAVLRLSRLEASTGRDQRARERLTALLARKDLEPSIAYMGRLFLGEILERQGAPSEAERLYREAIELDPVAQSARVALGRAQYLSGNVRAAAATVEPLFTEGTPQERNDPWSNYQLAYPALGVLVLDDLRDEVQQ